MADFFAQYPVPIIGSGSGSVVSVGVKTDSTTSAIIGNTTNNLPGSPITTSGNITITLKSQTANKVLAGPTGGGAATPAFRTLVAADLGGELTAADITITATSTIGNGIQLINGTCILDLTDAGGFELISGNARFDADVEVDGKLTSAGGYHIEPSEFDAGNSGTTKTLDLTDGSAQKLTLTGSVTLTLTNPVAGGAYLLRIVQGASAYTVTWPMTVLWPGGTAPTITTTNGAVDIVNLYWDGTSYYGTFAQDFS